MDGEAFLRYLSHEAASPVCFPPSPTHVASSSCLYSLAVAENKFMPIVRKQTMSNFLQQKHNSRRNQIKLFAQWQRKSFKPETNCQNMNTMFNFLQQKHNSRRNQIKLFAQWQRKSFKPETNCQNMNTMSNFLQQKHNSRRNQIKLFAQRQINKCKPETNCQKIELFSASGCFKRDLPDGSKS